MEAILQKIKISKESEYYKFFKALDLNFGEGAFISTASSRSDDANAVIVACVYILFYEDGQQCTNIDVNTSIKIIHTVNRYIKNCCIYMLMVKGVTINQNILNELDVKINTLNAATNFYGTLYSSLTQPSTTFLFQNDVKNISFDDPNSVPQFILNIISQFQTNDAQLVQQFQQLQVTEKVEEKVEVDDKIALVPGLCIFEYTLVEKISSDKSEIWKVKRNNNYFIMKMQDYKPKKKNDKTNNPQNQINAIINEIKESDDEFKGWKRLTSFPHKTEFFYIYYIPSNKLKIKILTAFTGNIIQIPPVNADVFIFEMTNILKSLHETGMIFNNICKEHIVVNNNNEHFLIDYRNVAPNKSEVLIEKLPKHGYNSLSVLMGSRIYTFYDDIESLLYLFDDIITDTTKIYDNQSDEINKKNSLSVFSSIIANAILQLRQLRANDQYANSIDVPPVFLEYINNQYAYIYQYINNVIQNTNTIAKENISLNITENALFNQIRNNMVSDPRFNVLGDRINKLALMATNYILYQTSYSEENMHLINLFLQ